MSSDTSPGTHEAQELQQVVSPVQPETNEPASKSELVATNATSESAALQLQKSEVSATKPMISLRDLTKDYHIEQTQVHVLKGITLDVLHNEFVAIMGPSGSGKSTLMNILGCLDRPTSGEYRLDDVPVNTMSTSELGIIRNQHIGFVFQSFNLLPRATAVTNVALPLIYAGVGKKEREQIASEALKRVGLGRRLKHRPSQLSGGQQQRVAIARALINHPSILLADEPTGNLDSRTSAEIMATFQVLHQQGLTIILVTHDPSVAAYAQREIELRDGLVVRDERASSPSPSTPEPAGEPALALSSVAHSKQQDEEKLP